MNDKQNMIDQILAIVIECCDVKIDGVSLVTADDVRSKKRDDNILMTRAIFVSQMMFAGYSRATTAAYLHREIKSIGNILNQAHQYRKMSKAYRKADAEATIKINDMIL